MECLKRKKEKKRKEVEKAMAKKCFLENGSKFLEALIAESNGITNPIRMFNFDQISTATNNLDTKFYLFVGDSYGWYKGVIEGRPYAIKNSQDTPGVDIYRDIVISARVSDHSGFIKLMGCCLEFPYPAAVFECPEHGALNIKGSVGSEDGPLLPWNVRLKIAKEVAIAITYLHTAFTRIIIHRDIKASNVFLDKNWTAKLTDFSWSLTLPEGKTWIEDNVVGTMGYVDPNYIATGIVTEYCDVYSFGIFMLVLLLGIKPFKHIPDSYYMLNDVKGLLERGEVVEFGGDSNDMRPIQMKMFLDLALRCCEKENIDRPKMIVVAKELKLIESSPDC